MQENRFDYCEIPTWKSIQICRFNLENSISLGVLWENNGQFMQWTENNFSRKVSEQFLNSTKQKIILCKILENVYAENSEQFLWESCELF